MTLSLAVMLVFGPHALVDNVLGYRSISGYFGITGLLDLAHLHGVSRVYADVFTVVLIAACWCSLECSGIAAWTEADDPARRARARWRFPRSGRVRLRNTPTGSCLP